MTQNEAIKRIKDSGNPEAVVLVTSLLESMIEPLHEVGETEEDDYKRTLIQGELRRLRKTIKVLKEIFK